MAKVATVKLSSVSPYSQSAIRTDPKLERETDDAYDERTWQKHLHVNARGEVIIPCSAFTNALVDAAKYDSTKIPGKGSSTYTKHIQAGVMVVDEISLGIPAESVCCERLFLDAKGQRGGNQRVWRRFPVIPEWRAEVRFYVMDEAVTPEIFEKYIRLAGMLIGIGRWRPQKGGINGRFKVESIEWSKVA